MKINHIYEIDVLRFIGAGSVLLYHYTFRSLFVGGVRVPMFPILEVVTRYGFIGLNLFFMISGFVILFSAFNKSPTNFAISRIDRLFPQYWVCVTLTTLVIAVSTDSPISFHDYVMNLTLVNDVFKIPDIDVIYWTLHAELKFYFIIFILLLIKELKNVHIWLPIWLLITIVYLIFKQPFFMVWFINPFYSSYFISGILYYLIYSYGLSWRRMLALMVSMTLCIIYSIIEVDGFIRQPTTIDRTVVASLIILLHIIFFIIAIKRFSFKGSKKLMMAGSISYPLYLLHLRIGKTVYDLLSTHINRYVLVLGLCLLMILISLVVNYAVENRYKGPMRRVLLSVVPNRLL